MGTWRKLFGPSKQEIWRQLSTEIEARYVEGGLWKGDKVQAIHGEWTVTLDTYAVSTGKTVIVFTRMRAPYVNPDGFRFTIYRKGVFSDLAKRFGMQDVEVGVEPFDRDFIIKGTDETKLRELFSSPTIRDLIAKQPEIHFEVKDDELYFAVPGVIKDVERLKLLYELFGETLDQLCRMGSAQREGPDVTM